jgi:hypothetical protein
MHDGSSGASNYKGPFDQVIPSSIDERDYSQNTAAAHNAGIALAWMLPRLDKALVHRDQGQQVMSRRAAFAGLSAGRASARIGALAAAAREFTIRVWPHAPSLLVTATARSDRCRSADTRNNACFVDSSVIRTG